MAKPPTMDPALAAKKLEYEERKARAKALKLRLTCTICGSRPRTLLNCPCGSTQYCSTDCQRIDWRDRGHRAACKKIRNERAAEAARAEAPPSPPEEVVYGPAPRSHADEVRARIAAEHEAARARREANPEPKPTSERFGGRCPICMEKWNVNVQSVIRPCCCRTVCESCAIKIHGKQCPLCRMEPPANHLEDLARLRRHVDNGVPEAMQSLGFLYDNGRAPGLVPSKKKAAKLYKRAVELGNVAAMNNLSILYEDGEGGVKRDQKKAMQLLRMAADRGHAIAQHTLGHRLEAQRIRHSGVLEEYNPNDGPLVPDEEGFKYLKLAADQGLMEAEHEVGVLYGASHEYDEAERYLSRAAAKGCGEARHMLWAMAQSRST